MADKLLVRVYNVGLGDCIYVRVPDRDGAKHLLIDCGNKFGKEEDLKQAISNLKDCLPAIPGQVDRRLDLLVATHAHEDHVQGFSVESFQGIQIDRLWMSAAMNKDHPQAEGARALQAFALTALDKLRLSPNKGIADWAQSILSLSKAEGMEALVEKLSVGQRRYVHADTPAEDLALFTDPAIRLHVLAPMYDIDRYYLGEVGDELKELKSRLGADADSEEGARRPSTAPADAAEPTNVSREDFDLLRRNLTDSSLAFVLKEGELVNNTSVVLLLEWRGRRLLFTGDAEVKTAYKGEFQEKRGNGSWNVMWHKHQAKLSQPVDFLKVGHHGSHNATPWTSKKSGGAPHPVNAILDSLLPSMVPGQPPRYAVVSTERSGYPTIPDPDLMVELGRRVTNVQTYQEPTDQEHFVPADKPQPQRTDLHHQSVGSDRVAWIDIELTPLT